MKPRPPDAYGILYSDGQWLTSYVLRCSWKSGTACNLSWGAVAQAMAFKTESDAQRRVTCIDVHADGDTLTGTPKIAPLWLLPHTGVVRLTDQPQPPES